jgi:ribosomal protein S18 acetylase RimI-like enzyme
MDAVTRLATLEDCAAILALMREYYAEDSLEFAEQAASQALTRLLAEPALGFVLVVDCDRSLVGYIAVCIGFSLEFGGNDAFIDEVFVSGAHRRCGYGQRLLEAAAERAHRCAVRALHLEVHRENAAAHLYASAGFHRRDRYFLMTRLLR